MPLHGVAEAPPLLEFGGKDPAATHAKVSAEPLVIDRCPKGDGLWFDKNELQNIFDKAHLDKDNKIRTMLADMFGYR